MQYAGPARVIFILFPLASKTLGATVPRSATPVAAPSVGASFSRHPRAAHLALASEDAEARQWGGPALAAG